MAAVTAVLLASRERGQHVVATHQVVDPAVREGIGISDGLLRLWVGLESADDLWAALGGGLEAALEPRALVAATA